MITLLSPAKSLNLSALNLSALNLSALNLSALNLSALNLSALNLSALNLDDINCEEKFSNTKFSTPIFASQSSVLVEGLKKLSIADLEKLMKISPKLAEINWQRFNNFSAVHNSQNYKPALFLFDGDVYKAMKIDGYDAADLKFAQNNLRILSGLYGILKPLDLIQPYRLEMGSNLKSLKNEILPKNINNLPQFWQVKIADFLNDELKSSKEKTIINLASEEYFAAIDSSKINGKIINIIFKEKKADSYKIIGLFAKRARGLIADFIVKNKIKNSSYLKNFMVGGYAFNANFSSESSKENNWCFCR